MLDHSLIIPCYIYHRALRIKRVKILTDLAFVNLLIDSFINNDLMLFKTL